MKIILDREEAIKKTLSGFQNSVILIAGKGNEKELEISGISIPMSDFTTIDRWLVQNNFSIRGFFDYLE